MPRDAASLFTPDFRQTPYWWDQVDPPGVDKPALPDAVDVLVVGAGYTGLHAALQTAAAGRRTLVIDAEAAGWGCSSRNGGQISISIKPSYARLTQRHGRERALSILREGEASLHWIGAFIRDKGVDCDFRVDGRFHAAHSPAHYERLARQAGSTVPGIEQDMFPVSRADQRTELGTDAYFGGVVYPRHASVHPARYHRGLLRTALDAGVTVVPRCPATGLSRDRRGFAVRTPDGFVHAGKVVVATNGYTGRLTPWHRRRVIPIGSYMIATEPIDPAVMNTVMPTNRVISDTRKVVYYYRPTPDRSRIVFGGRVCHRETDLSTSATRLHREMVRLFPALSGTRVSHSWMGFVGYSFDSLMHVGDRDGLHFAMGYCGSGVAMASYLGMRVGQQVLGLKAGRTAFDGLPFPTRPFYDGAPWFVAPTVMVYRLRDRFGL